MGKKKVKKAASVVEEVPVKEEAPVVEKRSKMPEPMGESIIDVQFGPDDLAELVNLLSVSAETYDMLAKESLKLNDEKSYGILSHRMKLSEAFANRLALIHGMGEAQSRELH